MKKVAVIMLGGAKQGDLFWPSYFNCSAGYAHDLILIHRDYLGVPTNLENKFGGLGNRRIFVLTNKQYPI